MITFETAQDGTGIVNIIQTGGNERKVTIKEIKRDYNAQTGMTELSGIVNNICVKRFYQCRGFTDKCST